MKLRALLLSCTLMALMLSATSAQAAISFSTSPVATAAGVTEIDPETSGRWIVYTTDTPVVPNSHSNVVMYDRQAGSKITIGGGDSADQTNPDVSGDRVAYEDDTADNLDVRVYDRLLAVNYPVATSSANEVLPRISGNLVAWYNESTDELWYRDLSRGNTAKVPSASDITFFDVDNGRIVWGESLVEEGLYYFDPSVDAAPHLFYTLAASDDLRSLRLHGDNVAVTIDGPEGLQTLRVRTSDPGESWFPLTSCYPDVFHDTLAYQYTGVGAQLDLSWYQFGVGGLVFGSPTLDDRDLSLFGRRAAYEQATTFLNSDIYMAESDTEIDRTEGADRYATAVEVSKEYFAKTRNAVLCTGANFPDALAAGPLANAMNGPLLLTKQNQVPAGTIAEMHRLGVDYVAIVGGTGVISNDVRDQLLSEGINSFRIGGRDRYETSVFIAGFLDTEVYHGVYDVDMAFFARGDNFPDALAVGPVAAGALSPVILVGPRSVPASVANAVDVLDIKSGVIVGGPDVVSEGVRSSLETLMIANGGDQHPIERWYGDDRYETAVDVLERGLDARWIDLDAVGIATGLDFPDALGGGAALGHYGSPLLLVGTSSVPSAVKTWVGQNPRSIGRMDVFGGPNVVSSDVETALRGLLE